MSTVFNFIKGFLSLAHWAEWMPKYVIWLQTLRSDYAELAGKAGVSERRILDLEKSVKSLILDRDATPEVPLKPGILHAFEHVVYEYPSARTPLACFLHKEHAVNFARCFPQGEVR